MSEPPLYPNLENAGPPGHHYPASEPQGYHNLAMAGPQGQPYHAVSGHQVPMAGHQGHSYPAGSGPNVTVTQSAGATTTVVDLSQIALQKAGYPQNVREWTTGLCDCFSDCATCACGFFFPLCLVCCITSKMNENCCVALMGSAGLWAIRSKLRTQHGISGSLCVDCCCSTYCYPCVACQINREIKNVGL